MFLILLLIAKTFTFAKQPWSISLPEGYTQEATTQPDAQSTSIAYMPAPRPADQTRPMIQVTISPLTVPLENYAYEQIKNLQKRRDNWKVTKTETRLLDRKAIRYEWSGIVTAPNKVRLNARGVMVVGTDNELAVTLHAQDIEPYAATTLPLAEKAMETFKSGK